MVESNDMMLCIMCKCEDIKNANVIDEVKKAKSCKKILKDNELNQFIKNAFGERITCVKSEVAGVGKSTFIKDKILGQGL